MFPLRETENAAIQDIVLRCGQQARVAADRPFEVFEKGIEDFVTTVDRDLDRALSQAFAAQFPQDGIVTEENQASTAAFWANHGRTWFIDPIDGTEDFIQRGIHYSVMVGLLMAQQPQAGWVYAPAQERLYWGGPGWGLFQRGQDGATLPLVPQEPALVPGAECSILLGDRDQRRFGAAIAQQQPALSFFSLGSFGLKVIEVIKGQAGLYVYLNGRVKLWDTTGPLALALAAGLTCCDLDGQPIRFDATSIYPYTLIHRQPMLIGWPAYIDHFREPIRKAVLGVRQRELHRAL